MLQIHLHAIAGRVFDVDGKRLAIIVGFRLTLGCNFWTRSGSWRNTPEISGRDTFAASNVLGIVVSMCHQRAVDTVSKRCLF